MVMESLTVPPGRWIFPLSSRSTLYPIPICPPGSHLGYQSNCCDITVLVFQYLLFYLVTVLMYRSHTAAFRSREVLS